MLVKLITDNNCVHYVNPEQVSTIFVRRFDALMPNSIMVQVVVKIDNSDTVFWCRRCSQHCDLETVLKQANDFADQLFHKIRMG